MHGPWPPHTAVVRKTPRQDPQAKGDVASKPLLVVTSIGLTTGAAGGVEAGSGPLCGPPGVGVGTGTGGGA